MSRIRKKLLVAICYYLQVGGAPSGGKRQFEVLTMQSHTSLRDSTQIHYPHCLVRAYNSLVQVLGLNYQ